MGHASSVLSPARTGRAVLIAGPTASGKSALALALAERLGGTVINADSMQVYRDLRIVTARPTVAEEARVPHRLYGHVDGAQAYSVGRWLADIAPVLEEAARNGQAVFVAGGTGLYFKALTTGLSAVPAIPPLVRSAIRGRLEAEGPAALHAELARRDPAAAAKLRPGDRVRIARALEVLDATGRPLADWHRDGMPALIEAGRAVKLFLAPDRDELKRRIDARFDAMMAAGAIEEVRALVRRGLDPLSPVLKAHGVPWLGRVLTGEMSLAAAADAGKRDTRRYTKRQFTWFRHQMPDWQWAAPGQAEQVVLAALDRH